MTTDVHPVISGRDDESRFRQLMAQADALTALGFLMLVGAFVLGALLLRELWPPRFDLDLDQTVEFSVVETSYQTMARGMPR